MKDARSLLAEAFSVAEDDVPEDAAVDSFERWDSLGHVTLLMKLEQVLGRELDVEEAVAIIDISSVQTLLDAANG